jgi:hypothetical protein
MAKLQRKINPIYVEQAKERTIQSVMEQIDSPSRSFTFKQLLRPVLVPTLVLIAILTVLFFPEGNTPIDDDPGVILTEERATLAELSYLTSSFIGANLSVQDTNMIFLLDTTETEFESEEDNINLYFDTLRIYLEDIDFNDLVTIEALEDSTFDYLIRFELENVTYDFYITLNDSIITGELVIGGITFDVTGSLETTDIETSFELEAISGSDYVHISYTYEEGNETESKYIVSSFLSGVESEQEITVSFEDNEAKVQIKDGTNEYTLKREIEDMQTAYKLEYKINGVEGEARIQESMDSEGNTLYQYSIKEGGVEKDIERGRPNYDFDDNPGNGQGRQDEDDSEEDEPNGNGTPNNQSNEKTQTSSRKSV